MSKKWIFIAIGVGVVSFGGAFAMAWFTAGSPSVEVAHQTMDKTERLLEGDDETDTGVEESPSGTGLSVTNLTQAQLKSLIFEVREKIKDYKNRSRDLEVREQRLKIVRDMLNEDIKELSELRVELATAVAGLKAERDRLEQSRVSIAEQERLNLIQLSATYDKMDATSAGDILLNMSQNRNSSSEDAVKILYYMQERNKAKVLAAIAETEPAISAYYCSELKKITERE